MAKRLSLGEPSETRLSPFGVRGWAVLAGSAGAPILDAVDPVLERLHGYGPGELLGRPLIELFAARGRDAVEQAARAGNRGETFESIGLRKDGSEFPALCEIAVVESVAGGAYSLLHVHDVSGNSRVEDSIERANLFLEAVIENLPHMVFVKDAERLSFVRFNRAGEELLGMPRSELIGKNDYDFFPRDEAEFFQAKDRETLENRVRVDIAEEPIETRHGRRLLRTAKVPILDERGTPRYLLGISEDITDRKAGEDARARLAAIVEDSDEAILSRTLDGTMTSWNRSAERMFGYTADEIVGHPVASFLSPQRLEEEIVLAERIAAGERIAYGEVRRRTKHGDDIEISMTHSPLRDARGEIVGISTIARDVSGMKRIHRELVRAKEATEAANRELEAFSYSVAHDLRAPLRSIDGFSLALLEDYSDKLDDVGRDYLRFVRESAQLMAQLIDDILLLSRVTRAELARAPVDLSAIFRSCVERLATREPSRQVDVVIENDLEGEGDERLIAVMLENLAGNAWKFTSKREHARVEFGAARRDGEQVYFVRDDGAGFDMEYANKLFGVFQRLHSTAEFEGTGVGLATVQRIVHRHGGRVWAEARVGEGATFYFTLGAATGSTAGERRHPPGEGTSSR